MPDLTENLIRRVQRTFDPEPMIRPGYRKGRGSAVYASQFGRRLFRMHMYTSVEMVALIDQACGIRNVNRSTYLRRAVAILIAHDLRLPVRDVLVHSPGPGRQHRTQDIPGSRDQGEGIEDWCTHPGCDGGHLR